MPVPTAHGSRPRDWLTAVEADELADRRPAQLSGGQAQRVAVARAVAADPRLLLLDEPLAALDVTVAPLRPPDAARRPAPGRTTVLVTHDLLDALLLSDRIIVLENGTVVETGPTTEVLRHPHERLRRPAGRAQPGQRHRPDGEVRPRPRRPGRRRGGPDAVGPG